MVLEVLITVNNQQKDIKDVEWKEYMKLPLFIDDMILYIENPQEVTEILLKLRNPANPRVNKLQKPIEFLYTTSNTKIKKISLIMAKRKNR